MIVEEGKTVETSEETSTETEVKPDETQTEEIETEETETTKVEESADIKTEESEEDDSEVLDETELLTKGGFERYVGKGGIEKLIEDYAKGQKGFTETQQAQALLDKLAKDAGLESGRELIDKIQKDPTALRKVLDGDKTPQPSVIDTAFERFSKRHPDWGWTKEDFQEHVEVMSDAMGLGQIMEVLGMVTTTLNETAPLALKEKHKEFSEEYKAKHKGEPLAPFNELTKILQDNKGLYQKARKEGKNPFEVAYKIWILENKSEELLGILAKAMEKKGADKITAMKEAQKVLKKGKEEITKDYGDITPEKLQQMPKAEREKVMKSLIPSLNKAIVSR